MNSKEYTLPNGKKAVFEYDVCGIGKITLECMDELMGMIADRPQGEWTKTDVATYRCSECGKIQIADDVNELNFCCCCGSRNKVRRLKGADDDRERL